MRNIRLLVACTAIFALVFVNSCDDSDGGDPDPCNYNNLCEPGLGETAANCTDCSTAPVCGNGDCELGENATNCPADCAAPYCGDGNCDANEDATSCPADCATNPCNNDGTCDAGETVANCPADCSGDQCATDDDILFDNGCDTGQTCDMGQTGPECRTTGATADYATCAAPTDCGANAACMTTDGGTTYLCLPYCDIQGTTPTCPGAGVCAASIENHPSLGLCLEQSDECDPVDNTGCTGGDQCFLVATGAACSAPTANPGAAGSPCDQGSPSGCVAGASCFNDGTNNLCFEVCNLSDGTGCDSGTCQNAIGSADYGICQ
jgi:hypothetical protein